MNIFESSAVVLVCPTNGVGALGKGLALQFATLYPRMVSAYQAACRRGEQRPGQLWFWQASDDTIVCCLPTKRHWKDQARYEDVFAGIRALAQIQRTYRLSIALPPVGCGLGGLDWAIVEPFVREHMVSHLTILV